MRDGIQHHDFRKIEWADTLDTCHVYAKLAGVRTPLMVSVNIACLTKVEFRVFGIELIKRQVFLAFAEFNI